MPDVNIFGQQFWKAIVLFEISTLEFVKNKLQQIQFILALVCFFWRSVSGSGSGSGSTCKYVLTFLQNFLKVPVAFFHHLGSLILKYLDNMLIISKSLEETLPYRHIVIILMQQLSFVINQGKYLSILKQILEFSGMKIDSKEMTISLPKRKSKKSNSNV